MKIIDAHVHIGLFTGSEKVIDMTEKMVIDSMSKYKVDFSLVSNLECCCFDSDFKYIDINKRKNQNKANMRTINFARKYPDKIGAIYTAEPYEGKCDNEFETIYQENKDVIYGIKIHPYHSATPVDDEKCEPYLKFAEKYNLPVIVHTASDDISDIKHLINAAKRHPYIKFQAVHMGLGTDNKEAIEAVYKYDNIYGDTTWVKPEITEKAIIKCGEDKIIFGTDNPIDGIDTYAHKEICSVYLNGFRDMIPDTIYRKIMCENARNFFGIL